MIKAPARARLSGASNPHVATRSALIIWNDRPPLVELGRFNTDMVTLIMCIMDQSATTKNYYELAERLAAMAPFVKVSSNRLRDRPHQGVGAAPASAVCGGFAADRWSVGGPHCEVCPTSVVGGTIRFTSASTVTTWSMGPWTDGGTVPKSRTAVGGTSV